MRSTDADSSLSSVATLQRTADDERKELLARMDSLKPKNEVNMTLKYVLAVMESGAALGPSGGELGGRKRRRTTVSTNRDALLLPSRPWKKDDELPKKKCWFLDSGGLARDDLYVGHFGKIAKMADDGVDVSDREAARYTLKYVHENVNLNTPGEVAWCVRTLHLEDESQEAIFHTKQEAKACRDMWREYWIDYYQTEHGCTKSEAEGRPVDIWIFSVRVECSVDELADEVEAERKKNSWFLRDDFTLDRSS